MEIFNKIEKGNKPFIKIAKTNEQRSSCMYIECKDEEELKTLEEILKYIDSTCTITKLKM